MLVSETLPNLLCAAAPLFSPENTIKIVHFDPVLRGIVMDEKGVT